jgi:hypothetical protein
VGVVCCQVEVSASGRSLLQGSPTDCGVPECDRGAPIMWRPWVAAPPGGRGGIQRVENTDQVTGYAI